MKRMLVLGFIISSALLVVSCKSQIDSSSKDVSSKSSTESEVTKSETTTESSDDTQGMVESETYLTEESSESVEVTSSLEETIVDSETTGNKEVPIKTPTAEVFYTKLTEWNIPLEYYSYDDSTSMDSYLSENGDVFSSTYIHYFTSEGAKNQFTMAVKDKEVYDIIENDILETENEPRMYVARGHFQFDETSPILPDYYVIIQFEQEYIYLYGRGEIQIQRAEELVKALDIELPI